MTRIQTVIARVRGPARVRLRPAARLRTWMLRLAGVLLAGACAAAALAASPASAQAQAGQSSQARWQSSQQPQSQSQPLQQAPSPSQQRLQAPPALRLIGAETSFYCLAAAPGGKDAPSGLACELMAELARRAGHAGKVQLYPLARALMVAASSPGVLVGPVARIPFREKLYRWQIPIFEDEFVVVANQASTADISSLETISKLAVGVLRDGAAARLAEEQGWPRVSLVAHDDINARKLQAGRIDAWISSWNGILAAQRNIGAKPEALRRGVVVSRVKIYLASSTDVDPERLAAWRAAFDDMVKDGSYDSLLKKYQFELPK